MSFYILQTSVDDHNYSFVLPVMAFKKGVLNVKVLGTLKIHLPIDGKIPPLSCILRKDVHINITVRYHIA